jgi:hypothetical protein
MNLLCPNCQKPLTVPEQYAGQPMRCPLCAGTFTVPALPQSPQTPTAPAPPPAPPEPRLGPAAPSDVYGLKEPPPPGAPPPPVPDMGLGGPPPASKPAPTFTGSPPPPTGPAPTYTEEKPSYPSTPLPEGYQRKCTIWFSPQVLQYVAPAALFLVLVLTFFPWTGVYPGGVPSAWQNAWQGMIPNWYSSDPDVIKSHKPFALPGSEPGWNFLLIFYMLLLLPTLLVTIGCLALAFVPHSKLPPAVYPVLPWRWGIVAALNLVLLMFLALQLVLGFSLEDNYTAAADKAVATRAQGREGGVSSTEDQRSDAIERGEARRQVSWTIWLDLVVLFHIVAIAGAGLMFWVSRRGGRPAARMDLLW